MVRGRGRIRASARVVAHVILDEPHKGQWDELFVAGQTMCQVAPGMVVRLEEYKGIWPVAGRDFVLSLVRGCAGSVWRVRAWRGWWCVASHWSVAVVGPCGMDVCGVSAGWRGCAGVVRACVGVVGAYVWFVRLCWCLWA